MQRGPACTALWQKSRNGWLRWLQLRNTIGTLMPLIHARSSGCSSTKARAALCGVAPGISANTNTPEAETETETEVHSESTAPASYASKLRFIRATTLAASSSRCTSTTAISDAASANRCAATSRKALANGVWATIKIRCVVSFIGGCTYRLLQNYALAPSRARN